jgi:regulatory protein
VQQGSAMDGGQDGRRRVKAKALQWLAQREHSRVELARKLSHWQSRGITDETCDAAVQAETVASVLDELTQAGLLSDERFTQSRLHQRQGRFGNRRIAYELKQHGLLASDAQWSELHSSEAERARAVLEQKFKAVSSGALPADQVMRAQRFLVGRGFSSEAIRSALRQASCAPDTDATETPRSPRKAAAVTPR